SLVILRPPPTSTPFPYTTLFRSRSAVLTAGWPDSATGVTLNRFCGSGAQAVNFAAMGVMSGQQEVVVGGGVESMSRVPMGGDGRSEEHTAELQSLTNLVCRLLLA